MNLKLVKSFFSGKSSAARIVLGVALCSFAVQPAFAQEVKKKKVKVKVPYEVDGNIEDNRTDDGKILRGSYLTNLWFDNWSFGVMGGVQAMFSGTGPHNTGFDLSTGRPTAAAEVFTTKWFTPTIGTRFGYQTGWIEENFAPQPVFPHYPVSEWWYNSYAHVDILWNVINTFSGYKLNRAVNFSPYIHGGYYRIIHKDADYFSGKIEGELYRDREMGVGAGALVSVKLGRQVDLLLDFRDTFISGRYHSNDAGPVHNMSVNLGVQYTLRKWYFKRSVWIEKDRDEAVATAKTATQDAERAIAVATEAQKEVKVARSALEEAEMKLEALESKYGDKAQSNRIWGGAPIEVSYLQLKQMVENADLVTYFYINSYDLNFSEEHHLDNFVTSVLKEDPDHVFYLTGSADKQTGSFDYNVRLSSARANTVKKILIDKYKVPEENVIIKQIVVSDKHLDGAFDRCVIIESE